MRIRVALEKQEGLNDISESLGQQTPYKKTTKTFKTTLRK